MATTTGREAALARRQQLIEALRQSAATPQQNQMVGGQLITPGWAGLLGQLGSGAMAGYMQQGADKEQADIEATKRQQLMDSIQAAQGAGTPEQSLMTLAASENPDASKVGLSGYGALMSQRPKSPAQEKWKALPGARPGTLYSDQGGSKVLEGVEPAPHPMAIRGELVDASTAEPGMYGQASQGQKIDITMPGAPEQSAYGAYTKELGKGAAQATLKDQEKLDSTYAMDQHLDEMESILQQGARTGGAVPAIATINNVLQSFGVSLGRDFELSKLGQIQTDAQLANVLTGEGASRLTDSDLNTIRKSIDLISQGNAPEALAILRRNNENKRLLINRKIEARARSFQRPEGELDARPGNYKQDTRYKAPPQPSGWDKDYQDAQRALQAHPDKAEEINRRLMETYGRGL